VHPLFGRLVDAWTALDDAGKLRAVESAEAEVARRYPWPPPEPDIEPSMGDTIVHDTIPAPPPCPELLPHD
jgi:hypothetical protein